MVKKAFLMLKMKKGMPHSKSHGQAFHFQADSFNGPGLSRRLRRTHHATLLFFSYLNNIIIVIVDITQGHLARCPIPVRCRLEVLVVAPLAANTSGRNYHSLSIYFQLLLCHYNTYHPRLYLRSALRPFSKKISVSQFFFYFFYRSLIFFCVRKLRGRGSWSRTLQWCKSMGRIRSSSTCHSFLGPSKGSFPNTSVY